MSAATADQVSGRAQGERVALITVILVVVSIALIATFVPNASSMLPKGMTPDDSNGSSIVHETKPEVPSMKPEVHETKPMPPPATPKKGSCRYGNAYMAGVQLSATRQASSSC